MAAVAAAAVAVIVAAVAAVAAVVAAVTVTAVAVAAAAAAAEAAPAAAEAAAVAVEPAAEAELSSLTSQQINILFLHSMACQYALHWYQLDSFHSNQAEHQSSQMIDLNP